MFDACGNSFSEAHTLQRRRSNVSYLKERLRVVVIHKAITNSEPPVFGLMIDQNLETNASNATFGALAEEDASTLELRSVSIRL